MNNKFRIALSLLLLGSSVINAAEVVDDYAPYLNPPGAAAAPSPLITNKPVFGRIFGVQGSGGDIEHYVFDLTSHTRRNAAIRSALVPGWGQSFNGDKTKGLLLFLTTTAAAVGSVVRYNSARHSYDDYKAQGIKNSSLFDDYEDARLQAMVLGSAALVLYGFGILDAHRRGSVVNLSWTGREGQLSWEKRF